MDKPDKIWVTGKRGFPSRWNDHPEKGYHSHIAYLLATPERELASELVEALREVFKTAEDQEAGKHYPDSKVGWEMAMDDVSALAWAVLAKLEGKG